MTAELKFDYQQNDHDFDAFLPTVKMVRDRRVESESSELLALTDVMTAIENIVLTPL